MDMHNEVDPMYKPSTNSDIAREGCAEFASLLRQFSQNERNLFYAPAKYIRFIDVWRCVAGISAEIAFEEYILKHCSREVCEKAAQIINSRSRHFLFYRREKQPQFYHLFNLLAVRQVATNYPEYFPAEVVTDPRGWLEHNWQLWADGEDMNCIRYGLLSGFPLEAVLNYAQGNNTRNGYHAWSSTTNLSYWGVNKVKEQQYMEYLDRLLVESGVKEKLIWTEKHSVLQ